MRECGATYHESTDASLRGFPLEAAVDVVARVDQEHDAASNSVEVAQQKLKEAKAQRGVIMLSFEIRKNGNGGEIKNRIATQQAAKQATKFSTFFAVANKKKKTRATFTVRRR